MQEGRIKFHSGFEQYLREGGAGENKIARHKTFSSSKADPEAGPGPRTQIHREQKKKLVLTINELIKWLSKPEIKNNKKIRSKLVPKTDKEWFDLMESNISEPSNPEPQAYYFLDLNIEVPWPILFSENEEHHEVWQNGIQYAKDMFKKTKPGFWIEIDEKFLVREISEQSEVGKLDSNTVVYGLYRIRKPDVNRLIPMKDGAFNCVAQRVIKHFDNTKRGHEFTEIRQQKINDWEKKMHILGARVQDVA
ncbi:3261_t:CDS:2, partial [Racocetra persica]